MIALIRTVLFDLDGTLADSLPLIRETYEKTFREMGIHWTGEVMELIGLPLVDIARRFAGDRAEEFRRIYGSYYRRDHDRMIKLFPGCRETLEEIAGRGLKLGLVTAKRRPGTERTLKRTGIDGFFGAIVTVDDVERHKPDPMPVLRALELLESDPSEALFVGDSPFDIEAGRRAGTMTGGALWGMADRETLAAHGADYLFSSLPEVLDLLREAPPKAQ